MEADERELALEATDVGGIELCEYGTGRQSPVPLDLGQVHALRSGAEPRPQQLMRESGFALGQIRVTPEPATLERVEHARRRPRTRHARDVERGAAVELVNLISDVVSTRALLIGRGAGVTRPLGQVCRVPLRYRTVRVVAPGERIGLELEGAAIPE